MRRSASRLPLALGVLALAGWLVGADACEPTDPVVTLESLQSQIELQRIALCAAYAERGQVLDLPTFSDPDCP